MFFYYEKIYIKEKLIMCCKLYSSQIRIEQENYNCSIGI